MSAQTHRMIGCVGTRYTAIALVGLAFMLVLPAAVSADVPSAHTFDVVATGTTTATVEGNADPNGGSTTYAVEYDGVTSDWCTSGGTSGSPANITSPVTLDSTDTVFHNVSVDLTDLTEGETYCAQLIAVNASGEGDGGLVTWSEGAPTARTVNAFSIGNSTATIEGVVNPGGEATTYGARYDLASSQWCSSRGLSGAPAQTTGETPLGSTSPTFQSVSVQVTGLDVDTWYCAELVATNADGTSTGAPIGWTQPLEYGVGVSLTGGGSGTVTSSPAGIDCGSTCSGTFVQGTQVTLEATPAAGSLFGAWLPSGPPGATSPCSGQNATCTFTVTSGQTVIADFEPIPTGEMAVTLAGAGSGTVTSSPAGIECGSTCSHAFPLSGPVTVTAAAAARGSTFSGWSGGGCLGTGPCTNFPPLICVTTITATFHKNPPPPTSPSLPPPQPKCTLKASGPKVKVTGRNAGNLTLKATSDQAVSFSLTGKATIKPKTDAKAKKSHVQFETKHGATRAGSMKKLTMKLPKAALSKLKKHAAESVVFKLKVKNANGSCTDTARIKHLNAIRRR